MLTREQILQVQDHPTEVVPVEEWGGEVTVRTISGREKDVFEADIAAFKNGKPTYNLRDFRAKLCALVLVGDDGKPLFSRRDVDALSQKFAAALDRVVEVAKRLNGFSDSDVEDLAKNSETGQGEDSPTS